MNDFLKGYLTAALWTTDEDPRSGEFQERDDWSIDCMAPEAIASAQADCDAFYTDNHQDLSKAGDAHRNGVDFWLTRNGHGAGFWDRGYGDVGKRLSDACKPYGESDLYRGDDGKLYFS